jgi:putative membrane protein
MDEERSSRKGWNAMGFIAHILVTAVLLFVLGQLVDGIVVRDGKAAVIGALVLGLANAFVRPVLILLTLPVTIVTLGFFILVVNALMLMLAAALVDGFEVRGFAAALWGSVVLAVMNFFVGWMLG